MKKRFTVQPYKRVCFALLLLIFAFIIHSCRKEVKLTQQQINAEVAAAQFPVSQAKEWFSGHRVNLGNRVKLNATNAFLSKLADFTPVWDSARTAVDTNYYAVEAPTKYLNAIGFGTDSGSANVNGLTRLLVLKSKKYGSTSAILMQIHGDAGSPTGNVHYMDVPQNFSGHIFFTNIQGVYINGYIYKNGKVILKSSAKPGTTAPLGPKILVADGGQDCWLITIETYTRNCIDFGDHIICGAWVYDYGYSFVYCVPEGSTGSGGDGTVAPPNVNCPPAGGNPEPIVITAVKGKLYINVRDPGDGGEGGDPTDPQEGCLVQVPVPVDTIRQPSVNPKLNCILNKLHDNIKFQALINAFTGLGYNLSWGVDDLPVDPRTGRQPAGETFNTGRNFTTLLDKSFVNSSSAILIAKTLLHEAFHANLSQRAYAVFGTTDVSQWTKRPEDMTLIELMDKIDQKVAGNNQLEATEHEYMAANITAIADGLQQIMHDYGNYTEFTTDNYLAMAYNGLYATNYYQKLVADKTKEFAGVSYSLKDYFNLMGTALNNNATINCD